MYDADPGKSDQPPTPGTPAGPGQPYPPAGPGQPYPPAGGWPGYAPPRPTNTMALASFIVSLVSLFSCPLIGIVSIVLGRRARDEIRRTGEQGEGLAQAGVIIGWIGVGLAALSALVLLAYFGFVFVMVSNTTTY